MKILKVVVRKHPIKCPHCNKVFFPANNGIEFSNNVEHSNIHICGVNFPTTYFKDTGILIIDYPNKLN